MLNNKDKGPVIVCPYCNDSDDFCSSCQGTKEIREFEYIGNLMLQAMYMILLIFDRKFYGHLYILQ